MKQPQVVVQSRPWASSEQSQFSDKDEGFSINAATRPVLRQHKGFILLRYWVHLLPIGVSGVLAWLNFTSRFFLNSNDQNAIAKLSAFQFVAKLHEVLICASMTLIVMDYVRNQLLHNDGIALGHLLSATEFTNFAWVFSSECWGPFLITLWKRPRSSLAMALLLTSAISLSAVVGPLSAILVVPRPGWSSAQTAAIYPVFINSSASDFWPSDIVSNALDPRCFTSAGQTTQSCPASALKTLWIVLDPQYASASCSNSGSSLSCNGTLSSTAQNNIARRLSITYQYNSLTAIASAPSQAIFDDVAGYFDVGLSNQLVASDLESLNADKEQIIIASLADKQGMFKPVVTTTCQSLSYADLYKVYTEHNMSVTWDTPSVTWIGDVTGEDKQNLLFTYLTNSSDINGARSCDGEQCYGAIVCSVKPTWVPMKIWYNTKQLTVLYQDHIKSKELVAAAQLAGTRSITIEKEWLRQFDQVVDFGHVMTDLLKIWRTPMTSAVSLQPVASSIQTLQPANFTQGVSIIVSSVLAEALARLQALSGDSIYTGNCDDHKKNFSFASEICQKGPESWIKADSVGDLNGWTLVTFSVSSYGYGWFMNSITIQIASGVLLLHALLVLVYLLTVFTTRRNITTRWSSSTQFLFLAIQSLPSQSLRGTPEDSRLWGKRVTVREVNGTERLTLAVGEVAGYGGQVGIPPQTDKKYL